MTRMISALADSAQDFLLPHLTWTRTRMKFLDKESKDFSKMLSARVIQSDFIINLYL